MAAKETPYLALASWAWLLVATVITTGLEVGLSQAAPSVGLLGVLVAVLLMAVVALALVFAGVKVGETFVFHGSALCLPVLDGKTVVLFDLNWNIVSISRQIMTSGKLGLQPAQAISATRARQGAL